MSSAQGYQHTYTLSQRILYQFAIANMYTLRGCDSSLRLLVLLRQPCRRYNGCAYVLCTQIKLYIKNRLFICAVYFFKMTCEHFVTVKSVVCISVLCFFLNKSFVSSFVLKKIEPFRLDIIHYNDFHDRQVKWFSIINH